ncbi:hypothetical protein [Antarctobacter sp.]|uniref:hypothetical protein n=1 Tax=Antarctobacter sp. TaxID=1872577 RepID=UPI002B2683A2|nr:hypothetical protein [Antarctobacter sp.]
MFGFLKSVLAKPKQSRLAQALTRIDTAAEAFRSAAETCGPPQSQLFWRLAGATSDLRNRIMADPAQITPLRKLIFFFIPKMSELCTRWARLAASNPLEAPDHRALEEFQSYLALIRAAEQSCLSQQYGDLHASMETMEQQLDRHGS